MLLFVADGDLAPALRQRIGTALPDQFRGWPVRYGWDTTPADHWVTVTTLSAWLPDFRAWMRRPG